MVLMLGKQAQSEMYRGRMDGGWMDGGWINGRTDGWTEGWIGRWKNKWMEEKEERDIQVPIRNIKLGSGKESESIKDLVCTVHLFIT